jgi:hypothetical protein
MKRGIAQKRGFANVLKIKAIDTTKSFADAALI